jgi:hypothetical protein
MFRWDPDEVFEIEAVELALQKLKTEKNYATHFSIPLGQSSKDGVQTRYFTYYDEKTKDSHPVLEATGSLPFKSSPIMWSKLLYSSFSLSFNALDMTDMSSP